MKLQLSNGYYLRFEHLSRLLHYVVGKPEVFRFAQKELASVLGIDGSSSGIDLCGDKLYIEDRGREVREITSSPRVGVSGGRDRNWRFYIKGNKWVSRG